MVLFGKSIDFEGKNSKQLKCLIEDAHWIPGHVDYMRSDTKNGAWMAVSEILI